MNEVTFNHRQDVRIYCWEIDRPAYRHLDPVARALLIELRAIRPLGGEVALSVREAMQRLGTTQRPVQRAFKALEDQGWIQEVESRPWQTRKYLMTFRGPDKHG